MTKPIHKRKSPELPTSIKVGHRDIAIVLATEEELEDAYGTFHSDTQLIRLGDWIKPQSLAETLIHELLHACWPARWSTNPENTEECIITSLAPTLSQVWRDNPELVEWITHNLLGE